MGQPPRSPTMAPGMARPEETATPIAALILDALVKVGVLADARPLIEQAVNDADPTVRVAARRALATSAGGGNLLRGIGKLLHLRGPGQATASAAEVSAMMKDNAAIVRAGALMRLGSDATPATLDALEAGLKDPDRGVRIVAMDEASRLSGSSPRVNAIISAGLADADLGVVAAAAEAARARKDASLGGAVVTALNRPMTAGMDDSQTRALTALSRAAGRLKAPGATSALVLLLAHDRPEVRAAAAAALGELGDATAVPSLVSASRSEDADVAGAAVIALSGFNAPSAEQAMLAALQNDMLPEDARRAVLLRVVADAAKQGPFADWAASGQAGEADMTTLASIAAGAPAPLQPGLIAIAKRGLQDQRPEVRRAAAIILGRFSSDLAVQEAILDALEQDASGVAGPAADILRQNKDAAYLAKERMRLYRQLVDAASSAPGGRPAFGPGPMPGGIPPGMTPGRGPGPMPGGVPSGIAPGRVPGAPIGSGYVPGTAPGTGVPPAARGAGLARASLEENMLLRQAIIDSVFNCHSGDEAARALLTIKAMESDATMRCRLIDALARTQGPLAVGYVAELAERGGGAVAPYAVETLARIGPLNRAVAEAALQRIAKGVAANPGLAAAAQDALDTLIAATKKTDSAFNIQRSMSNVQVAER